MDAVFKSVLFRFLRGTVAGAVSTMIVLMPMSITSWKEVSTWLSALAIAGVAGAISGLLQAIDKYLRTE